MGYWRIVFQTVKEHQLHAKYRKSKFWLRLVTFLWHVLSTESVEVGPSKMVAVKNFPRPLTHIDIRTYLGLACYYQKFVGGFASISSALTTFTQMLKKFEWSNVCEKTCLKMGSLPLQC